MKKYFLCFALCLCTTITQLSAEDRCDQVISNRPFAAKDFSHLFGMRGFSDKALSIHFCLYQGYVGMTNAFLERLALLGKEGRWNALEFAECKRHLGWEYDGMRLHELFFENLGGEGTHLDQNGTLYQEIEAAFGSFACWESDFKATGVMRGIGWVILYRDPLSGRLTNMWIEEHSLGHLAGGTPLLVMDVWEHAYFPDYDANRKAYIEAFFQNIHWPTVEGRL